MNSIQLTKSKRLVIVGDGEFASIAYEYFTHDSVYKVEAFSVETPYLKQSSLFELPVVPFEALEQRFPKEEYELFVAVTHTQLNRLRMRLFQAAKTRGYRCANYISSHAFVWHNARLGENCFVFENNVIQPFVTLGDNIILWSGNHVGHRTQIEDHCFISSHAVISGYCNIGTRSFLGVNSTITDHVRIAPDNLIGAGAVVTQDTLPSLIYSGNPAKASKVSALRYFKVPEPVLN